MSGKCNVSSCLILPLNDINKHFYFIGMSVIAAMENLSQLSLDSVNNSIISLLECPVCYDYLIPPIRQCKNAHNICSQCKKKITKCPICKEVFLNSRSVLVEQIVEKLLYPCVNSGDGCHEKRSVHDILKHQGECPHRMYECLPGKTDSCNWMGRNVDILDHTINIHASKCWMHDVNNVLYDFNIFEEFEDVQLLSAHDEIFWYNFSCDNVKQKIFLAVQYIGSKERACMFLYEFQLYTDDDEERSIIITNRTHPDTEKASDIYDTGCCIILDFAMLRQYVDNRKRMTFWLRVSRSNTSQFLE
jgi:hypothetical protein